MPKTLNRFFYRLISSSARIHHGLAVGLLTALLYTLGLIPLAHAQIDDTPAADTPDAQQAQPLEGEQEGLAPPVERELSVPDTDAQQAQLLTDEFDKKGLITLTANDEDFPALWHTDTSGTPLGAVLIFHGEGEHANWPITLSVLREHLTRFGWATLSITLPNPKPPLPPARPTESETIPEETTEADPDGAEAQDEPEGQPAAPQTELAETEQTPPIEEDTTDTAASENSNPQDVEKRVQAHVQAAMDYLKSKGQYNIVFVGYGLGAARASRYLDSIDSSLANGDLDQQLRQARTRALISRPIRALILVNARNTIPYSNETKDKILTDWLNDTGLPVLDIYSNSHYLDAYEPADRLNAARKKQLAEYRQIKIQTIKARSEEKENALAKRVRGFLNKHAKGVKIDGQ